MESYQGRIAAITGAGSGIGRGLAEELVARGAHVALSDIDPDGLAETALRCEGKGVKVTTRVLDVADRDAVHAWAEEVVEEHGSVNLIVNNAGVALVADVVDMSYDDLEWVMNINFWGVVHGTKAFLPHLEASGEGHVVNVSSVFGLVGIPSQSAYNAAKFAVRGFTDALRVELEIARSCVSATTVHPGGINTSIVRNARFSDAAAASEDLTESERALRTPPAEAAEHILDAVLKNRRRTLPGSGAKVIDAVSRLPAGFAQRLLVAGARRRARRS
jgi:NAD(P)-dependent dehydrogenase (short-subunit alcohol dehydrogenase family)